MRAYTGESPLTTTLDVCVYKALGYEYARYAREYYILPSSPNVGTLSESGVAFSFDGSPIMYPSFSIGNKDSDEQHYMGQSRGFLQQTSLRSTIDYYSNLPKHIVYELNGTVSLDNKPDFSFEDTSGSPLPAEGVGISVNKRWVSFASPNIGVLILDTHNLEIKRISNRYELYSHTSPRPEAVTSPSGDGRYIVFGGWAIDPEVYINNPSCGAVGEGYTHSFYSNLPIANGCSYRDLKEVINEHSPSIGNTPFHRFMNLQMNNDGGSFNYYDGYQWASIYAHNMRPLSEMRYLALGDSFASGEGDMSNSNKTYYIPGTNVVGNYPAIPQEMCHISSRSYPFLIASKMGLAAGGSMKSIACSGAVANDVLTFDTNNFERILADNYMGQGRIGSGGPRLLGVPNAPALQAEARQSTLPGRVQQIELVQKTKPEAVTIMMGGNDLGFGSIMMGCANLWNWGRFDGDCEQTTGPGEVKMVRAIQAMYPEWLHMYKNIKKNTSSGKVYVIGYPHFLASDNICSEMAGLYSATERKSINQTIDYANATMKNAALDAGVWFIDVHDSLEGKELCGRSTGVTGIDNLAFQAIMSEYMRYKDEMDNNIKQYGLLGRLYNMNPTFLTTYQANRSAELAVDAAMNPSVTFGKTFQQLSHPNSVGHQAIFDRIASGLGPDMLDSEVCNAIVACPELDDTGGVVGQRGIPSPGQYIEGIAMDSTGQVYVNGDGVISIGGKIDKAIEKSAGDAYELTEDIITRYHIDISVPMKLYIHSTPTYLGTFESVNGKYIVRAAVPESVPVGMHTLHVSAATTGGKELDIVKYVMVLGPRSDVDDDGTPDGSDRCAFGDASSQDGDSDGLADNCDMYVAPAASKPVVSTPSHLAGTTKPLSTGILPAVIGDNASSGFDTSLPAQSSTDLKSDEQVRATLEPTNTASGQTSSIQSGSVWWVVMLLALAIVTGYIVRRQRS